MGMDENQRPEPGQRAAQLTDEQLRAFEQGWAVTLMPVPGGWKLHYFSSSAFATAPGTTVPTFEQALADIATILPAVNSPVEQERARQALAVREGAEDKG